ncbi:ComEA family DNA-binding protein [Micromonospora sp. CPCC 205371]|nr:ComEA family DNA-binding protein [Micromonospora sp. CPCC 205371]
MPRAAARRSQPAPHSARHYSAAARSRDDSVTEAAVHDVPPPPGRGAHPWELPPSRDLGGRAWPGDPAGAAPSPDPALDVPRPGWERAERVDDAAHWRARPDEPDERPSRFGGASPFDPGRRGVKALAVVGLVVVLVAAVIAWRARPRPQPITAGAVVGTSAEPGGTADGGGAAGPGEGSAGPDGAAGSDGPAVNGAASASPGEVVVAVAGKVRKPGLVRLPAGARVADAVEAAGGALPGTDVALLNLARKVTDGELILVGVTAPPAQPGGAGPTQSGGKVNLNTATLAELDALPGVGPVLAQRILDHRDQHGGFRSVSDLRQVDGIGEARYEQLKELVIV